jgi:hypothetical protein
MVLVVVLLSPVLGSSLPPSSVPLPSPTEQPWTQTATKTAEEMWVVEGIEARPAVQAVLVKVRNAIGSNQRLLGVKSLVVEGDRNGSPLPFRILPHDAGQDERMGIMCEIAERLHRQPLGRSNAKLRRSPLPSRRTPIALPVCSSVCGDAPATGGAGSCMTVVSVQST